MRLADMIGSYLLGGNSAARTSPVHPPVHGRVVRCSDEPPSGTIGEPQKMNLRHEILKGAAEGATLDDLVERTGEDRHRVKSNVDATIQAGLITRHRDDVTGLPAYRITDAGRQTLATPPKPGQRRAKPAAAADAQPAVARNTGSDGSAVSSATSPAEAIAVRTHPAAEVAPPATPAAADDTGTIEALRAALATAESQRDAWRDAIGAVCDADTPEEARAYISSLHHENATLHDHIDAPAMRQPTGYLVAAPKRPLRRVGKFDTARKLALAAARNGSGRGEVFALVPVGRAVRGAEWRQA